MSFKKLSYLILIPLVLIAEASYAGALTTTFNVTATIGGSCQITANNLAFGVYNPTLATSLNSSTTLIANCTISTPYNIGLNLGTGSGASLANRYMTQISGGTNTITYNLYLDSGYSSVWGTTIGTNTYASTGTGSNQTIPVYGQISASNPTTLPIASYSDTILATITY